MSALPTHYKECLPKPPAFRSRHKIFSYLAALLSFSWLLYVLFTPTMATEPSDQHGFFKQQPPHAPGSEPYGLNAQPSFSGLIQLMDLPPKYVPETGKHRHSGRLVVVGDVHGMRHSLLELLEKVKFDEKHDHLILAGDIISKGPDSPGVVDLAMKLGATVVRGNHEDRIILAYRAMVAEQEHEEKKTEKETDLPRPREGMDEKQDSLEEISGSHGDIKDKKLVKELGKKRMKWLESCPVILRVGKLGDMGEVVVVHAGLAPGVELEKQDPSLVMNMRTIKDGVPSDEREGKAWQKEWNHYQKSLPKKYRSTVIYGHDSKRGLQMGKYSMGIDTGCLKGGKLSAVIIEGGHSDHKHSLVQVTCKDGRQK